MHFAKDASIAILGASIAFGGLLVIFCRILFAQAAAFPKDTTQADLTERYAKAAKHGVLVLVLSLLVVGLALCELLWPTHSLFVFCSVMFFILLTWTGAYIAVVSWRYL